MSKVTATTVLPPPERDKHQSDSLPTRLYHSRIPEIVVLLLAGLARFWRLGTHSIWFDEAVSLRWASSDPSYTWRVTFALVQDKHPPAYYLGLHFWQKLLEVVGLAHNDAALRASGSVLGVLTVWGAMLLARRLGGRPTALLTGLFLALAPALIWYSQELRMFQPATTVIVLSAYCLASAWLTETGAKRALWWAGFIVTLELALHTYLFSAFILPTAGVTVAVLAIWGRSWRRFVEGAASLFISGLLFLPLARNAWLVSGSESTPGRTFENVATNLRRLLQVFTVWRVDWPDILLFATLMIMALLVVLGLLLPLRKWGRPQVQSAYPFVDQVWLAIWIGIPLLVANFLLGRSRSIFTEDRYLLFIAPFVLWSMARGVVALAERSTIAAIGAGLAVVLSLGSALPIMWQPSRLRENWRAASDYIVAYQQATPGLPAAVVTHIDYTHYALEWYLRQQASFEEIPTFFPFGDTLSEDEVAQVIAPPLNGIVDFGSATLWLTQSHLDGVDDQRLVESWLNQNFPIVTEQYPNGVKLSGHSLQSNFAALPPLAPNAIYPNAALVPGLHLVACEVITPRVAAHDQTMHPPSGWVHVRSWWQRSQPLVDDYTASAQVVGPAGIWGEHLIRGNELMRRSPTSTWPIGAYYARGTGHQPESYHTTGRLSGANRVNRQCGEERRLLRSLWRRGDLLIAPLPTVSKHVALQFGDSRPLADNQFSQKAHQQ